jgi:phosphatidylglycerol---prolipoprotein diacylglyceryl transferase
MHPVLFELAGLPVRSYGLIVAAGFLVGLLLAMRAARRQGLPPTLLLDLGFWILISSLCGSRLLHVLTEAGTYAHRCAGGPRPRGLEQVLYDCTAPLHLWEGGLVFYGGLLAAAPVVLWFCRRHQLRFLEIADLLAPFLALGHFIGRLGCLAAGCCYGKPVQGAFGLSFPRGSVAYQEMMKAGLLARAAAATPPLHATQLYEALCELCIGLTLLLVARRKRWHGQVVLLYGALYATGRLIVELFRADPDRHYLLRVATPGLSRLLGLPAAAPALLSTSQAISLLLLIGIAVLWWRRNRAAAAGS